MSTPSQSASPASSPTATLPQIHHVYQLYRALVATSPLRGDAGLGGKLLFAGGLHAYGRDLLYASNIAGAASLAASADAEEQRSAIREGVVDFVVTSLAEALRILKNEVRKAQAVSVGIAADQRLIVKEMLERGVLPDLLPQRESKDDGLGSGDRQRFLDQGALAIGEGVPEDGRFVSWTVNGQHARWLARLDLCAQSVLPPEDVERHRWLRLAPRYLGRLAQKVRTASLTEEELARFRDRAAALVIEEGGKNMAADGAPLVVSIQPMKASS